MVKKVFPYTRSYSVVALDDGGRVCGGELQATLNVSDPRAAFPEIVRNVRLGKPGVAVITGNPAEFEQGASA